VEEFKGIRGKGKRTYYMRKIGTKEKVREGN